MFGHPVPEFTPDADDLAASDRTLAILQQGVQRCIDAGSLVAASDPTFVATWLWASTHGLVSLELAGYLDLGPKRGVSAIYDDYLAASLWRFLAVPHA